MGKRKPPDIQKPEPPARQAKPGETLRALRESSFAEIEVAGLVWRIEAITSRDMLFHTSQYLLALPLPARRAFVEQDAAGFLAAMESQSSEDKARAAQTAEAAVCAGTRAVRQVGGTVWDPVVLVMNRADGDDESKLWIGKLPPGTVQALSVSIFSLSGDNGRAAERLSSFCRAA